MRNTMYTGGLFSVQMRTSEVKKAVAEGIKRGESLEIILRGLCTNDSEPQYYGVDTPDKDVADNSYNDYMEVRFLQSNKTWYCEISCTMTESYIANEDGDWVDGSDYSYNECMTATEEATVLSKLGIKEFLFPDDEYCDAFFGGEAPYCVDEDEVRRLADEWDMPFDEVISQMHTASADEIREYGV